MFEVGKKYRRICNDAIYGCICVVGDYAWMTMGDQPCTLNQCRYHEFEEYHEPKIEERFMLVTSSKPGKRALSKEPCSGFGTTKSNVKFTFTDGMLTDVKLVLIA